jgi:glycosyltransferase involved in cell wall biosynthesis
MHLEKIFHKKMDIILTNSLLVKKQLIEQEDVKENKIIIIKNFFDPPKKKINLKKKLGLKSSERIFALVANLIPYKNHVHLIKASAEIKSKNWKLLFIGEDRNNYKLQLEKEIQNYNLEKNIIFTGFLDDIEMCLEDLEFVVNVSNEEGSSNSLLQALASGLPILASNIETNLEFVEHNKNGFLYKHGNLKDLTKHLEALLNFKDLKKMGDYSKKLFYKKFNYKQTVDDYLHIYQKLIS